MGYDVIVPDGKSGNWSIETFIVDDVAAQLYNSDALRRPGGGVLLLHPGTYKRLCYGKTVVMSNTPMECRQHMSAVYHAKGHVLIAGLGLGMYLNAILQKKEVTRVTVIEKSEDVIKLVAPSFVHDDRVEIIHADIFEWKPPKGESYYLAWYDIWNDMCSDNLKEMTRLKRKFGHRVDVQRCWAEAECREHKKRDAKERRRYIW